MISDSFFTKSEEQAYDKGYEQALNDTIRRIQMRHDDTIQNSSYLAGYKEALRDVVKLLQDTINED